MNNPNNFIQAMQMFKSPRNAVMNAVKSQNNPMLNQLVQFAEQGKEEQLETFARNYAKEHGIDFDAEMNSLASIWNSLRR